MGQIIACLRIVQVHRGMVPEIAFFALVLPPLSRVTSFILHYTS